MMLPTKMVKTDPIKCFFVNLNMCLDYVLVQNYLMTCRLIMQVSKKKFLHLQVLVSV